MSGLTEKAKLILKGVVPSPSGRMIRVQYLHGVVRFIANKQDLIGESNGTAIANWDSALEELVTQGLLGKVNEQTFKVTPKGYECAESPGF